MRSTLFVLCVLVLPGVAAAQVGPGYGAGASQSGRTSFFVGPSYRSSGDNFNVAPRSANVYSLTRSSSLGSSFQSYPLASVSVVSPNGQATSALSRYYPSLNFTPRIDMRPQEYVIPPVPQTPLHDPFFEERVFSPYDDDPYEFWGW